MSLESQARSALGSAERWAHYGRNLNERSQVLAAEASTMSAHDPETLTKLNQSAWLLDRASWALKRAAHHEGRFLGLLWRIWNEEPSKVDDDTAIHALYRIEELEAIERVAWSRYSDASLKDPRFDALSREWNEAHDAMSAARAEYKALLRAA